MFPFQDLRELHRSRRHIFQFAEERDAADKVLIEHQKPSAVFDKAPDLLRILLKVLVNGVVPDDQNVVPAERVEIRDRLVRQAEHLQHLRRAVRLHPSEQRRRIVKTDLLFCFNRSKNRFPIPGIHAHFALQNHLLSRAETVDQTECSLRFRCADGKREVFPFPGCKVAGRNSDRTENSSIRIPDLRLEQEVFLRRFRIVDDEQTGPELFAAEVVRMNPVENRNHRRTAAGERMPFRNPGELHFPIRIEIGNFDEVAQRFKAVEIGPAFALKFQNPLLGECAGIAMVELVGARPEVPAPVEGEIAHHDILFPETAVEDEFRGFPVWLVGIVRFPDVPVGFVVAVEVVEEFAVDDRQFLPVVFQNVCQIVPEDLFTVEERSLTQRAGVVVHVKIIGFFVFADRGELRGLRSGAAGGVGDRTALLVGFRIEIVKVVQHVDHAGIVVSRTEFVAETVGADHRMGVGGADPVFDPVDKTGKKFAAAVAGSVVSLDRDQVHAGGILNHCLRIAELIGQQDPELVEHVEIRTGEGAAVKTEVVDMRIAEIFPVFVERAVAVRAERVEIARFPELEGGGIVSADSAQHDRLSVQNEMAVLDSEGPDSEALDPGELSARVPDSNSVQERMFRTPEFRVRKDMFCRNRSGLVRLVRSAEPDVRNAFPTVPFKDFSAPVFGVRRRGGAGKERFEFHGPAVRSGCDHHVLRVGRRTDVQIDQIDNARNPRPAPADRCAVVKQTDGDPIGLPRFENVGNIEIPGSLRSLVGDRRGVGNFSGDPFPVDIEREGSGNFLEMENGPFAGFALGRLKTLQQPCDASPFADSTRNLKELVPVRFRDVVGDRKGQTVRNKILLPAGRVIVRRIEAETGSLVIRIVLPVRRHLADIPPAPQRGPLQIRQIDV